MPMGFKNSPSIWQRCMNADVLQPVREAFLSRFGHGNVIHMYIDDAFLAATTVEEHFFLLDLFFVQLASLNLTLSTHKSFIGKKSVDLLGFAIDGQTITGQPQRIHVLQLIPPPKYIAQLCQFLGAVRYISDHLPRLGILLAPFNSYTGGVPATKAPFTPFPWNTHLLDAFISVRDLLSNPHVLFQLSNTLYIYLEIDASDSVYGSLLFQSTISPSHFFLARGETVYSDFPPSTVLPIAYFASTWPTMAQAAARATQPPLPNGINISLLIHLRSLRII